MIAPLCLVFLIGKSPTTSPTKLHSCGSCLTSLLPRNLQSLSV